MCFTCVSKCPYCRGTIRESRSRYIHYPGIEYGSVSAVVGAGVLLHRRCLSCLWKFLHFWSDFLRDRTTHLLQSFRRNSLSLSWGRQHWSTCKGHDWDYFGTNIPFISAKFSAAFVIPSIVYCVLISLMLWGAVVQFHHKPEGDATIGVFGAAIFYTSDALLVVDRWRRNVAYGEVLIMVTYYMGQLFIAGSVVGI